MLRGTRIRDGTTILEVTPNGDEHRDQFITFEHHLQRELNVLVFECDVQSAEVERDRHGRSLNQLRVRRAHADVPCVHLAVRLDDVSHPARCGQRHVFRDVVLPARRENRPLFDTRGDCRDLLPLSCALNCEIFHAQPL